MTFHHFTIRTLAVLIIWLVQCTIASASGLGAPDKSASGLGVANAMTASADDASATVYNPAGIAWLPGIHFMAGSILRWRNAGYNPAGALKNSGVNTGHGYLTQMKHGSNWGGSLGWSMPLAVNNNWSNYGRTSLRVNRINASLITAIDSTLAIAIGPDWYFGNLDLTDNKGNAFTSSANNGFGGHISAMWKPLPAWSFGALYRSSASMRFSGSNGSATIKLPDSARFGAAYRLRNNIRLEVDGRWTHWKKLAQLSVYSNSSALLIGHNLALRDTFDVMTGVTWNWRQDTRFRFGYAYEQGASKSSSFDPAVTDLSGHRLSMGAGSDLFGVHLDAAYSYKFQPSTTATGNAGSGKLTHRRQSLGVSISQYF
ncbi:MAG: outer membrane protein transport protein [Mariprofundales bacterium]